MIVHCSRHSYAAGVRQPMHSHSVAHVSLVLRGALRERTVGGEEVAGPLSMVAKLPGVRHSDEYGLGGAEILQVSIEGPEASDIPAWKWIHGGPLARVILRLNPGSAGRVAVSADEPAVADLIAGIRPPSPPKGSPPDWLRRVREQIDVEVSLKPSVAALAHSAGVHPVHLARCFRRWYSRSISGYLEDVRLKRATVMLADPRLSISHVAHSVGFADESHFCRRFHRELGFTPGRYRQLLSPPPPPS